MSDPSYQKGDEKKSELRINNKNHLLIVNIEIELLPFFSTYLNCLNASFNLT